MSQESYQYGKVEDFNYIQAHGYEYRREYTNRCMRLKRSEDRRFAMACLDYFRPDGGPHYRTNEGLQRCIDLLPAGQWRQGQSSHHLAIWPDEPDPDKTVFAGYWGSDATQVGDFKHGDLTWFCIMAHAYITAKKEQGDTKVQREEVELTADQMRERDEIDAQQTRIEDLNNER